MEYLKEKESFEHESIEWTICRQKSCHFKMIKKKFAEHLMFNRYYNIERIAIKCHCHSFDIVKSYSLERLHLIYKNKHALSTDLPIYQSIYLLT